MRTDTVAEPEPAPMTAAEMGRKGGSAKTRAKKAAARANLDLARARRWPAKKVDSALAAR